MLPNYRPGDHVMTFNWVSVSVGDVIAFFQNEKFYIKRVDGIDGKFFSVSGDNSEISAKMASVVRDQIVGKVIFKY